MRKKFLLMLTLLILALGGGGNLFAEETTPVAKVGNTEYATIDDAIAAWTNGTTLTLLADVTLSDVIKLSSQEHHYLALGTYKMTAAGSKNAIEVESYGRADRGETGALTITADATNPGSINAGSKACIYYKYDATLANDQYDRPIIYIKGGVFVGNSYSGISCNGHNSAQDKCATFNISGGTFNCGLNLTKAKLIVSGGTFNNSVGCTGGGTSHRLISGGTFKSFGFMTADAEGKFTIGTTQKSYNVGVYVNDEGYLVVGGPIVTEPNTDSQSGVVHEASTANYGGWNSYLKYSSAKDYGLYYTSVEEAFADNNKTSGKVTVYVDELDMTNINFKGTIVVPDESTLKIANAPANLKVTNEDGETITPNANGTYSTIEPKGNDFNGYTSTDGIWGEVWGNAFESFVIKVLNANDVVMGTTSLNNVGGIINGNVNVSWNLKLDAESNTDEYWEMAWTTAPNINNMPAKVELWVDGVKVSGGNVVLNGPDDLNKIYAAVTNADGKILSYHTSIASAVAAISTRSSEPQGYIALLRDTNEEIQLPAGIELNLNGFEANNVSVPVAMIDGTTPYYKLLEAFTAATEGQTITLLADATPALTSQRAITKAAVIDLGGKTLNLTEDDLYFGTTTFKNGTIEVAPSVNASTAVFWMFANQTLTFDNVAITATDVKGTYLIGINGGTGTAVNLLNGSSITINNETQAGLTAVICDNGTGNNVTIKNSTISVKNIEGRFYLGGKNGSVVVENTTATLNGVKEGFYLRAGQTLAITGTSNIDIILNETEDRYGINLTDITATYTKAETATVNATVYEVPAVAMIGTAKYASLQAAIDAVQNGETITILAGTISEGIIKLPATLTNVTIEGVEGAILKDMTISAADGNSYSYIGLTFDGITFDNSRLLFTGWRNGDEIIKDFTVTNCTFKNLDDTTNTAPVHINKDATEAVNGFTFTNNVIDGATGGSKSGVYAQLTGNVTFTGNVINNVSFRPYVIQITTDDGIADNFVVEGNTFSGSAVGRAQGLGSDAEGTDNVNIVVSNNIFKGITNAQQICYWNFNAAKTTADLSSNYYDIDILAYPGKIYYNSAAANTGDLVEMEVFPIYTELNEDGTINEGSAYTPVALAKIGEKNYYSLQAAVNAVQNGETINLTADITENVTLTEKTGLTYTIDGNGKTMNGAISVNSLSDTEDNRRITVKNIKFVDTADANVDFISSVNTNHYPRLTIEGCTFTGRGNDGDVAVRLKSSHSVVIKDCTGTGLHSFLQNTSGWNLTIENVKVTNSKSGLALGTVQGVTVKGCEIAVVGYGIRMDAQYNNNAVIESNEVNAFIPVVVRKAEVNSNITFQGTNSFTATNTDGLWCAIGTSEYEENGKMPTAATGRVKVALNDTGLDAAGIYGNFVPVAKIGEVEYATLEAAFTAATSGCTIDIINNVTVDTKWDCRYTGAKFTVPVTINGNGNTIKFTNTVNDNNWNTIFRFEENATVNNLIVNIENATGAQRVISAKKSLNVDGLNIVGSARYGIIFGEGATSATDLAATEIVVKNSTLNGTRRAISDNEGGKDVKSVEITGNTLNANAYISASESIVFNNNTANGEVDLRSYTAENVLSVVAKENTLKESVKNYIYAKTIDAQEEFTTENPPLKVSSKAELDAALAAAKEGNTITLTADIDYGTDQLAIAKAITLDLGGKTLTTRNAWGGMSIKNNPTIKNGTIVHASNTVAIKVWNATAFEDLVIDVQGKGDANKTIGGIVLQEGSTTRVGSIKNVTIKGAALTNGIETYNCGNATENVIGSMENVTIDAVGTGMLISAPCGTATNCNIKGGVNGIEIWIKGTYSASLDLVNSNVEGGVYAHDEFSSNPDIVNNGTLSFTADEATTGASVEDVTLTIARAENVEGVLAEVIEKAEAKIGDTYYITLAKAIETAKAGETVTVLEGTYAVPTMKAGIAIVGEGNVVFEGTLSGTLENLTMKNIHIKGANAQRWAYAKGNLLFENVTFEATSVYAIHFDGIAAGTNLTYKDCTIIGWAAMGGSPESCTFDGCTIKGNGTYGVIRTYFDATIKDCTFDVANVNANDNYEDGIHAVDGAYVTVTDCTNKNGNMIDLVNIHALSIVKLDDVEIKHVATVTTKDGTLYYRTLAEAFAAAGDGKNTTVTLLDNIDLAGQEWAPIGTSSNPFKGTFDGQNHTISNLVINGGSNSNQGFFGYTTDGEIKNVTFENAKVSGRLNVGVVAGTPYTSKYTNVKVTGHVEVNGMAYVGAVGGKNAYADWTNITVDVDETSYVNANSVENGTAYRTYVGGVVGFNGEGGHTFENISSNIKVIGSTKDIGGIFGIAHYGNKFKNITFTGAVEAPADAEEVGGIAGVWHNQKGYTVTFTNCTSTGTVKVGGVETEGYSIVGGAYNAANETSENSGSLIINGVESWLKVAKVGEVTYLTLQAAVDAVEENGTVTLIDNVIFTETTRTHNSGSWYDGLYYIGDKSFTIDLGGFTITHDDSVNDYLLNFKNDGSKANTIILKNGTLDAGTNAFCAICTSTTSTQKLTINTQGINIINNNYNGSTIKLRGGAELNVNAGTIITGENSYLGIECVASTVNIYDGAKIYMNGTSSYNGCLVGACAAGTVNVYGGYGKGVKGGFIAMTSGGTINIEGGEWIANTDGTIGNNSNLYVLTAQSNKKESGFAGPSIINVTGGTFRGGMDAWVLNNVEGEKAELNITGGNFNADPVRYCEDGYVAFENEDETYTVGLGIATVNDKPYIDLQEAIEAAGTTETTITIMASFSTDDYYTIDAGQNITLDLNGMTITGTDKTEKSFGLINNKGTLKIVDNSNNRAQGALKLSATVNSGWSRYSSVISNQPGGKLTVNGGTIEHLGGTDMAYAIDNLTNGKGTYAETEINGGTVKSPYRAIRQFLNGIEAQNILTVNGGTIEGTNKSIWMQDPSKNANTGTLIVNANANLYGDVYLSVTEGSTEWPVDVAIVADAIKQGTVLTSNVPEGYLLVAENGLYTVETIKVKEQTINLNNGWTWVSLFVDATGESGLESFENQLEQYNADNQIVQIKNQTKAVTYQSYYGNYGWYGNLKSLAVNDMYMVKIEKDNVVVELEDYKVNPADYEFNLVSGWTWLGFPSTSDAPVAIEYALQNITPNKGDQIKSQEGFATYTNNKWYGNLSSMTPGMGYMYKNNSDNTVTLKYPAEVNYRGVAPANITAKNNLMVPNMSKYANNMSIIAVVNIDGEELMTEDFEVAVFAGEELRGSARPIYVEDFNSYMLFLTVYGEASEELTFKYYDLNSGEELNLFADSKVVFEINSTVGSLEEALVLNYGTLSIDETSLNGFNVYPNPVNRDNAISFETTFDKVEVYNSLGVVVAEYNNVDKIDGIEAAGIYVIKVTNDNVVKYCRVIVK